MMRLTAPADQLRALKDASGLSGRQYARTVMQCTDRAMRAWLKGERPMPAVREEWVAAQYAKLRGG